MAEKHRMTPDEVVSYCSRGDGVDYVRDSLRWMVEQLMEAEVVRHEALLDRAGWETSPAGCRSGLGKLGAVRARNCG